MIGISSTARPRAKASASKRDDGDASQDFITLLVTAASRTASKRFTKTAKGLKKIGFNAGMLLAVLEPMPVWDIYRLSDVLHAAETFPNMLVIRGLPVDDAAIGSFVRRTGSAEGGNFSTPKQGHHWIMIDFDKLSIPAGLSLHRDPIGVCEHLVDLLPAEFHEATYHWQMSSSAGIGDSSEVSMHIWFWLKRAVSDPDLKAWAKAVNANSGYKLVDPALFQHVQAHYTAAPTFEGMDNPFPDRSSLHKKTNDDVDLVYLKQGVLSAGRSVHPSGPRSTHAAIENGFAYHLSMIGDHQGGDGFHEPVVKAAASYVGEHGAVGTDPEALYLLLRNAVLTANATNHDPETLADRASRDHIMPAILSAITKFGSQSTARRKTKLHAGVHPHFKSEPISVAEAERRLAEIATLGF